MGSLSDLVSCDERCRAALLTYMAEAGIECTVTTVPPIVEPAYEPLDMRCPHGRLWFMEPTGEQIMRWAEAGVQ